MQDLRTNRLNKLAPPAPEVSKRAKKSLEMLQQNLAETMNEEFDNDNYDFDNDFGNDFDASYGKGTTPLPMGDFISDDPDGVDLEDLSHLSLRRKQPINLPPVVDHNQSFADDHIDDVNILSQPFDGRVPTNASINNIVTLYLSQKWNIAVKRQPESQERLVKWERKMVPKLETLTDDYLAHIYGSLILNRFEGDVGRRLSLNEVCLINYTIS